ncbi:epoxide hydrolase family protein [Amycolatopsis minnesotensis]|uniref:Epoxide hydrolase n=1 Tax=Amycolatopsis minnesotensis TaxID=337894 RepID=A0ABN2S1D3_9PSEU
MPDTVTPWHLDIPQAELDDLRDRLNRTRWPEAATASGWAQGVPLDYLRDLCSYWANEYDWRATERRLNAFPQFRTEIDGIGVHFQHVRSPHPGALPLVLTHGWPGSIIEFQKVIGPLTDPVAHGGDAADAFHVVCPSLPGYGFSDKPAATGWTIGRIARAWAALMARLGYDRFGAQGSDWGSSVTTLLAQHDPAHVAGIHLAPPIAGPVPAADGRFTDAEVAGLTRLKERQQAEAGYTAQQATRPQTLGYGLVDSPAALCAWLVEKFWSWADHDGDLSEVLSNDELLDNVMLYWLPGTGASAARLYWESIQQVMGWFTAGYESTVDVPVGASVFPAEVPLPSRRWAERRFTDIRFWHELERGGHFGAFERPGDFVDDVRAFFRLVR